MQKIDQFSLAEESELHRTNINKRIGTVHGYTENDFLLVVWSVFGTVRFGHKMNKKKV